MNKTASFQSASEQHRHAPSLQDALLKSGYREMEQEHEASWGRSARIQVLPPRPWGASRPGRLLRPWAGFCGRAGFACVVLIPQPETRSMEDTAKTSGRACTTCLPSHLPAAAFPSFPFPGFAPGGGGGGWRKRRTTPPLVRIGVCQTSEHLPSEDGWWGD